MNELSNEQIRGIARWQHAIIFLLLTSIIAFVNPYAVMIIAVINAVCIYQLAKALGSSVPILWAIGGFVPILSLILLVVINGRATRAIRSKGISVGLFGANSSQLATLLVEEGEDIATSTCTARYFGSGTFTTAQFTTATVVAFLVLFVGYPRIATLLYPIYMGIFTFLAEHMGRGPHVGMIAQGPHILIGTLLLAFFVWRTTDDKRRLVSGMWTRCLGLEFTMRVWTWLGMMTVISSLALERSLWLFLFAWAMGAYILGLWILFRRCDWKVVFIAAIQTTFLLGLPFQATVKGTAWSSLEGILASETALVAVTLGVPIAIVVLLFSLWRRAGPKRLLNTPMDAEAPAPPSDID